MNYLTNLICLERQNICLQGTSLRSAPEAGVSHKRIKIMKTCHLYCTSRISGIAWASFMAVYLLLSGPSSIANEVSLNDKFSASIKKNLSAIKYSETTAKKLVEIASQWKTPQGNSQVYEWVTQVSTASSDDANKKKIGVCISLAKKINQTFSAGEFYDLKDVLRTKRAQCMGCAQLFWALANAIGIRTSVVEVERYSDLQNIPQVGHVCCVSQLSNEESVMVDIAYSPMAGENLVSTAFRIQDQYAIRDDHLKLKLESNPLMIHREVRWLDTKGLLASLYCNKAYEANDQKKYEEAINFYEKAKALSALDAGQYNNMGNTLHSLHLNDKALEAIRKSISLRPTFAAAHHNLGNILRDMQKQQDAIAAYEKAVALDDTLWGAWMNLGVCYYVSGADKKAVLALEKATGIQPTDSAVLLHLGTAYGFIREATKAQNALRKAISLDPSCISKARSIQAFLAKQGVKVTLED